MFALFSPGGCTEVPRSGTQTSSKVILQYSGAGTRLVLGISFRTIKSWERQDR